MSKLVTEKEVIDRIKSVHGDKYSFEKFKYTRMKDHTYLSCKTHGDFLITPHKAIFGRGCRKCSDTLKGDKFRFTNSMFIQSSKEKHGDNYRYDATDYTGNNKHVTLFCVECNKYVHVIPEVHLKGRDHQDCPRVVKKRNKGKTSIRQDAKIRELMKGNKKIMEDWQYTPDWDERDLTDGSYIGFVYLFQFEDGSRYIGSKQMFKGVRNVKNLKPDSEENGWREYSSSSKIVNQKIADGEPYTRTILWGFPSMDEVMLVELILITTECLKPDCINLATMHKCKFPKADVKSKLHGIVQHLLEYLN